MKTFPTYDYTLCNTEGCKKKESCVRHLTYRKAQEEDWQHRLTIAVPDKPECDMYVEAKEETK